MWFLPGGYVGKNWDNGKALMTMLAARAGVKNIFLEEFAVYGAANRNEKFFGGFPDNLWNKMRFVSIGCCALVNYIHVVPKADQLSESCEWIDLNNLDDLELTMDNRKMIDKALLTLRERISYKPIGYNLLPDKFTLPELQSLYEVVLGRQLNRGNFYRKMKKLNILMKLDEKRKGGAHKSPDLYRFHLENYNQLLKQGLYSW